MKDLIKRHSVGIAAGLGAFLVASTAFAATGAADDQSLLELLQPVLDAFRGGDYAAAGALALVVLTAVLGKFGPKIPGAAGRFLGTEWGRLALLVFGAFVGSVAAQITGPAGLTIAVVTVAAKLAFYAGGGFAMVKKFLYPALVAIRGKLPGWAAAVLDVLLWVLDGGKARAIAKAEKAGAAAVAASPGKGTAGTTGTPRDVP